MFWPETDSEKPISTIALVYGHLLHIGGVETHLLSLLHYGKSRYHKQVVSPTSPIFQAQVKSLGEHRIRPDGQAD